MRQRAPPERVHTTTAWSGGRTKSEWGTGMEQFTASSVVATKGSDKTPPNRTWPPRLAPASTDNLAYLAMKPKLAPLTKMVVPPRVSARADDSDTLSREGALLFVVRQGAPNANSPPST